MNNSFHFPADEDLLHRFAERHKLKPDELLTRERLAVRATNRAFLAVQHGYTRLDEKAFQDPAVGMLLNVFDRAYEHVEGAICAFVGGSGSTAEVASRAAIELAINLAYISAGAAPQRLRAYFEHHFTTNDRQLKSWRNEIAALPLDQRKVHERGIDARQRSINGLRSFFNEVMGPPGEAWPTSVENRFKALDGSLTYRTFYARMSSEAHGDAEETIRYFVGKLQGKEVFEKMAVQTVLTSRLYVYYAVSWLVRAGGLYAGHYGMGDTVDQLRTEHADIDAELMKIAKLLDMDGAIFAAEG